MDAKYLESQRTLNGLACFVNNMYITYAIQHGCLSYIFTFTVIYLYAAKSPVYGQYLDLAAFHKDDFDAFCIIICSV